MNTLERRSYEKYDGSNIGDLRNEVGIAFSKGDIQTLKRIQEEQSARKERVGNTNNSALEDDLSFLLEEIGNNIQVLEAENVREDIDAWLNGGEISEKDSNS